MSKETLESKIPISFPEKVDANWSNGATGWAIKNATPGLYTLDIEHIPDDVVAMHNNPDVKQSVLSEYSSLCVHKCRGCFNEDKRTYAKSRVVAGEEQRAANEMLTLDQTLYIVDQAMAIAEQEGHSFESVKFLGPGELLINPQLFDIIQAYEDRGIQLNIFTKAAVLGDDDLAQKYHGMTAKELTNKLASYEHVGLLMSFQSFEHGTAETMVTSTSSRGELQGLQNYGSIRDIALDNIVDSDFYQNGQTNRLCMINAPISPENIAESFEIYRFFTERGIPVVMTPSMVSGKGKGLTQELVSVEEIKQNWHNDLVELYAQIYAFNVEKGIQTVEQIKEEGIASYVGAEPCNQASTGLYIRASGEVQMCPGRNDEETRFGNVKETPLEDIWYNSPNRQRGIDDPHNLINNRCPAKDGRAFPEGFYERVMTRFEELI